MRIDFHTHIFPPGIREHRDRFAEEPGFTALYEPESARMAGHEDLLETMARDGIDLAVAMSFPWSSGRSADLHNAYLLEAARASEEKIIPFACVPRRCGDIAACVTSLAAAGFRGIGELAFYDSGFSAHEESFLREVLTGARAHGMTVCVHLNEPLGHSYAGKYHTPFSTIYEIVKEFPDVPIVLSHWGGGILFYELMPEVRAAFSNVYYDTAASPFLYRDDIYAIAAEIAGGGKILFGTDFPLLRAGKYIGAVRASPLGEDIKRAILGDNAHHLLFRE